MEKSELAEKKKKHASRVLNICFDLWARGASAHCLQPYLQAAQANPAAAASKKPAFLQIPATPSTLGTQHRASSLPPTGNTSTVSAGHVVVEETTTTRTTTTGNRSLR